MNKNEKEIRSLFDHFVRSWEKAQTEDLDRILTKDCFIDFSIFDRGISVEEFKKQLAIRSKKVTYSRFEVYNYVCSCNDHEAVMSGCIQGLFVNEESDPCSFSFNGFLGNSLVRTDEGWKFDSMKMILGSSSDNHARLKTSGVSIDYFDGDTDFVRNWHPISMEVGWHEGSRITSVVPEEDCPWYGLKNRTNTDGSDEEKIKECFYRYCYALDYDCLDLYDDVFSEDAKAVYTDDRIYDKRGVTAMLRYEREGMIGMGHIVYFDSIEINGEIAVAHAYRTGYLPGSKMHGDLKYLNYVNARYDLRFIKEGKDWKILDLRYYPGRLVVPFSPETFISVSGK